MSAVELQAVTKLYGDVRAVDAIDLVVENGEFVTLLGPSGCGKTTTLRIVAGFVRPSSGTVLIGQSDVTGVPPHRREVGLVFQNYALFPHMSVSENVAFGLKMRGIAEGDRRERVAKALELVRLGDLGDRNPRQLSGGQQQRVALARALVIEPEVLLLDEPFGALDKQLRDHMRVELRVLQQQLGISTVFVTHDQEEAMAMSDRICVMADGKIRQIGSPSDIYERPQNRFVADFMGRSNLLDATLCGVENGGMTVDIGKLVLRSGQQVDRDTGDAVVMIRPERIVMQRAGTGEATVEGRVESAVYLGSIMHYEVAVDSGQTLQVTSQIEADYARQHFDRDERVEIVIPPEAIYILTDA